MLQLLLAILIGLAPAPVAAQDPVKVSPRDYKVEIENDWVRVLRVKRAIRHADVAGPRDAGDAGMEPESRGGGRSPV